MFTYLVEFFFFFFSFHSPSEQLALCFLLTFSWKLFCRSSILLALKYFPNRTFSFFFRGNDILFQRMSEKRIAQKLLVWGEKFYPGNVPLSEVKNWGNYLFYGVSNNSRVEIWVQSLLNDIRELTLRFQSRIILIYLIIISSIKKKNTQKKKF